MAKRTVLPACSLRTASQSTVRIQSSFGIPERLAAHVEELLVILADVLLHGDVVENRLRIGKVALGVCGRGQLAQTPGNA